MYFKKETSFGIPKKQIRVVHNTLCTEHPDFNSQIELFQYVAQTRGLKSQISGQIIRNPSPTNFLHVLPKAQGKYPEFKLYAPNIIIGTEHEHKIWDDLRFEIDYTISGWAMMLQLEAVLIELYNQLYL